MNWEVMQVLAALVQWEELEMWISSSSVPSRLWNSQIGDTKQGKFFSIRVSNHNARPAPALLYIDTGSLKLPLSLKCNTISSTKSGLKTEDSRNMQPIFFDELGTTLRTISHAYKKRASFWCSAFSVISLFSECFGWVLHAWQNIATGHHCDCIKLYAYHSLIFRSNTREQGAKEARNKFCSMLREPVLHNCHDLNASEYLMRHDPDRCWYVLPDGVTADEITSFVDGNWWHNIDSRADGVAYRYVKITLSSLSNWLMTSGSKAAFVGSVYMPKHNFLSFQP